MGPALHISAQIVSNKVGARLNLPRKLYGLSVGSGGSDYVHMESGGQLKKGGRTLVPPAIWSSTASQRCDPTSDWITIITWSHQAAEFGSQRLMQSKWCVQTHKIIWLHCNTQFLDRCQMLCALRARFVGGGGGFFGFIQEGKINAQMHKLGQWWRTYIWHSCSIMASKTI